MKKVSVALMGFMLLFLAVPGLTGEAFEGEYTVQSGDTLWKLSLRYDTSVAELAEKNDLDNPDIITSGQVLAVPSAGERDALDYEVKEGETLWQIAQRYEVPAVAIFAASRMENPHVVYESMELTIPGGEAPGSEFSLNDLDLLARLIYSESAGEPYRGQVAVAASVINRIESSTYPDTLSGVVFQVVSGHYQYAPVRDGRIWLTPDDSAYRAAGDAIRDWDPSYGATGFYNPAKTANLWVRNQPVTTVISNHVFFR